MISDLNLSKSINFFRFYWESKGGTKILQQEEERQEQYILLKIYRVRRGSSQWKIGKDLIRGTESLWWFTGIGRFSGDYYQDYSFNILSRFLIFLFYFGHFLLFGNQNVFIEYEALLLWIKEILKYKSLRLQ